MPFLQPRVSFTSNFAPLFSVMRYHSSVLFHVKRYMLWTKGTHKSANFQIFDCSREISGNYDRRLFSAEKVQGFYVSWRWGVMQKLKKNWFIVSKMTRIWFRKWHEKFGKLSPEPTKASILGIWWDPFIQSRKCISLKFTEDLCAMTMKNYVKFLRGIDLSFRNWHEEFHEFSPSSRKSQKFTL